MLCCFYILYSVSLDKYYVGYTCDAIENRIATHNTNHKGFTEKTNDWVLIHLESYASKKEAMDREKQVKAWKSRKMIEKIIG